VAFADIPGGMPGLQTLLPAMLKFVDEGLNLTGFFFCAKRAVMQMLTQVPVNGVRGCIINISSQHGMIACPGDFPYSVTKCGIVQMTRQLAVDHANDLIVCNAIAPGKIITGKPGVANHPRCSSIHASARPGRGLGPCSLPATWQATSPAST
jgi:glucose 1-dehydrogenase